MVKATLKPSNLADVRAASKPSGEPQPDQVTARRAAGDSQTKVYRNIKFAVLNAIPQEYAAVMAVFGKERSIPSRENVDSSIEYVVIQRNSGVDTYVALAGITGQGIAQAAAAAAQIKYKCRAVTKIILVGIAAGQPNLSDQERDVRLGDIVVGNRVIQYDHVKRMPNKIELRGDTMTPGDSELIGVVNKLRAYQEFKPEAGRVPPWNAHITKGISEVNRAERPDCTLDPNRERRKYDKGEEYTRSDNEPYVHIGTIGSASTLLKDHEFRDKLNSDHGTIAYEMEGAGLAIAAASSGIDYLMVRGICDYGDCTKDDKWQRYASVCAAAFARAVLEAQ